MIPDAPKPATTVLLVDDEPEIREVARIFLEMSGLHVNEASDGSQALERYAELNPQPMPTVVILDNRMPGLTGIQVAAKMLAIDPEQAIVLFTAFLDDSIREAAAAAGVTACLSKADMRRLPEIIRDLMPGV